MLLKKCRVRKKPEEGAKDEIHRLLRFPKMAKINSILNESYRSTKSRIH